MKKLSPEQIINGLNVRKVYNSNLTKRLTGKILVVAPMSFREYFTPQSYPDAYWMLETSPPFRAFKIRHANFATYSGREVKSRKLRDLLFAVYALKKFEDGK